MENSPHERAKREKTPNATVRPSAPRLLVRGLLALWWTFVVAAALSGAQTLGNRTGPAFLSYAPQFLTFVRRQPWQIQLLADIGAAYLLTLMAGITVLAYRAKREQGRVQEAAASAQRAAEMEAGVGRALDAKVVPQLDMLAQRQEMLAAAVVKPDVPALAPVSAPAPGAPLRVFIGSTSVDLEPYRTRIAELVRNGFGQHSVTMEAFPLRPTGNPYAPTPDATSVSLEELAPRRSTSCSWPGATATSRLDSYSPSRTRNISRRSTGPCPASSSWRTRPPTASSTTAHSSPPPSGTRSTVPI